jgi:transposase
MVRGVKGKIDSDPFIRLILDDAIPIIHDNHGLDYLFLQANSPVNVSKKTLETFADVEIPLLPHPPLSLDLNPMENVLALLVRRVYGHRTMYETLETLRNAIETEAASITKEDGAPFIESLPRRYLRVIESHGKYCTMTLQHIYYIP